MGRRQSKLSVVGKKKRANERTNAPSSIAAASVQHRFHRGVAGNVEAPSMMGVRCIEKRSRRRSSVEYTSKATSNSSTYIGQ